MQKSIVLNCRCNFDSCIILPYTVELLETEENHTQSAVDTNNISDNECDIENNSESKYDRSLHVIYSNVKLTVVSCDDVKVEGIQFPKVCIYNPNETVAIISSLINFCSQKC